MLIAGGAAAQPGDGGLIDWADLEAGREARPTANTRHGGSSHLSVVLRAPASYGTFGCKIRTELPLATLSLLQGQGKRETLRREE